MAAFSLSRRIGASFASAMLLLSFATCSAAADKSGAKDFASISRFKGAEIAEYATSELDATTLPIKSMPDNPPPASSVSKVEGRITRILYAIPAGKSPLEVMRNYEQALGGSSYKTVFACAGAECGNGFAAFVASGAVMPNSWRATFDVDKNRFLLAQRSAPGGDVYVLLYAMQETNYPATLYQETVELKPMQAGQVRVLDAAALKRGLDTRRQGRRLRRLLRHREVGHQAGVESLARRDGQASRGERGAQGLHRRPHRQRRNARRQPRALAATRRSGGEGARLDLQDRPATHGGARRRVARAGVEQRRRGRTRAQSTRRAGGAVALRC